MRHPRRDGFTLIELLVVIAIIAILVGLLIPAVQKVRETAARAQCQNNLKQIGIALHSYQGRTKTFPPGYIDNNPNPNSDASSDIGPGWGWAAHLLPDLEQSTVFNRINFTQNVGINPVCQSVLPVFLCPSDVQLPTFTVYNTSAVVAQGNYIASNGVKETSYFPGNNNGAFLRNRQFRVADITDGLSNTIFVGERNMEFAKTTWVGAVPGGGLYAEKYGFAELAPGLVLGHGSAVHLPNNPNVQDPDVFYSKHVAGINFLLGDGSVRSLNGSVSPSLYEALLGRNDGNVVGDY
jgi:prepilin-type N-terminal cleavage/methylation domain-containing protein